MGNTSGTTTATATNAGGFKVPPLPVIADGQDVLLPGESKGALSDFYKLHTGDGKLGRGHYGVVTKGTRIADGTTVAIKHIPKAKVRHLQMLRNEISILKMLDHPNIVKLYDAFEDNDSVYLVMELCTGGELFDRIIAKQHFNEVEAARVVKVLLKVLQYCHARNVVHRDLKPENFLLTTKAADADLKVIDFGLSKVCQPNEVMHARVGTPYYIAPEVLDKHYGAECDMWSVGVIMYILLCGYPPFWGDRDQEIFRKVRRGHVSFDGPEWDAVSDNAKDLIMNLLNMNPRQRISAGAALQHAWMLSDGGNQIHVISTSMLHSMRRFAMFRYIKRLAMVYLVSQLNATELAEVQLTFQRLNPANPGILVPMELYYAVRQSGHHIKRSEASRLIEGLDVVRQGYLTFEQVAAATLPRSSYVRHQLLLAAFEWLDGFHAGQITVDGIAKVLELSQLPDPEVRKARRRMLEEAVMEASSSNDKVLSYGDFLATMCGDEDVHDDDG